MLHMSTQAYLPLIVLTRYPYNIRPQLLDIREGPWLPTACAGVRRELRLKGIYVCQCQDTISLRKDGSSNNTHLRSSIVEQ